MNEVLLSSNPSGGGGETMSNDLISRSELLKNIESLTYWNRTITECLEVIDDAPTIEAEPVRHGRWIPSPVAKSWCCSECKTEGSPLWKRCPVCEAKMDLE